ncbi:MAG: mechanosensitive ion channel family protein [Bacteroidetes bacterium]|nr:MAG: mechanosensitive ion channel family protein [Bacteroidota bacterium]MBL1145305.1 mechanosensitive ion channel family protein [Bacteroidota bacterium]MCB0803903.1 mechanosensitive ion channel family protein [Flavobacteriales bacterium]NOG58102.1 mechanosensitive ion channel family protein [Bacteroidota bacterium]
MEEYFNSYSSVFKFAALVVAVVATLILITSLLNKYLFRKKRMSWAHDLTPAFNFAQRLLNALWIVLGLIAISFIFVDEGKYGLLNENFKLVLYLGVLSVLTIVLASTLNLWFKKAIDRKIQDEEDPTNYKFIRYVAVFGVYVTGILLGLLAFPTLHGVAQTALGGAGVIALVVGISSQEALANLIGGMFIIAFKPFRVGDVIAIDNTKTGTVIDITLRHTVIRTWQNRRVIIPNSIINKEKLENFSLDEQKCCEYVVVGISYDSDVDLAKKILREECEKHPFILDNRTEEEKKEGQPIVRVALIEFGESSVNLRAWAWAETYGKSIALKRDVFETVKKRFDSEGIEIPFPYRTLVMKGGEQANTKANK